MKKIYEIGISAIASLSIMIALGFVNAFLNLITINPLTLLNPLTEAKLFIYVIVETMNRIIGGERTFWAWIVLSILIWWFIHRRGKEAHDIAVGKLPKQ